MTINDHYHRRRDHQATALAWAEHQRLITSGDGRIQAVQPSYQMLWRSLAHRFSAIRSQHNAAITNDGTRQQPEPTITAHVPSGGK